MSEKKNLPELQFDETIGSWLIHEAKPEEQCTDGKPHEFQGWQEFEDGRGGTTVCTRCGITAFEHSMRYGP